MKKDVKKFKVITIMISLRNNKVANFGEIVDENQLAGSWEELVKGEYIEPVVDDLDVDLDEDPPVEDPPVEDPPAEDPPAEDPACGRPACGRPACGRPACGRPACGRPTFGRIDRIR